MRIRSRSYGLRAGVGAAMHYQARTRLLLVNTAERYFDGTLYVLLAEYVYSPVRRPRPRCE